jgi:anti-sigma regulatory factor (Ser/Thr protein kinase)
MHRPASEHVQQYPKYRHLKPDTGEQDGVAAKMRHATSRSPCRPLEPSCNEGEIVTESVEPDRSSGTAPIGPVEVRVPPDPSLSQVLRLAASGMAMLAGFTIDDIEKIKVAVSEVLIALIEHGGGHPIDVHLNVHGRSFNVRARTNAVVFDPEHPDLELSRAVLADVSDDHGIAVVNDEALIWVAVVEPTVE